MNKDFVRSALTMTLALGFVSLSPAFAAASSCDGSTMEMLECIGRKIEVQEKGITAKTSKILSILEANKKSGDGAPADYENAQEALKSANVKFDEAAQLQCEAEATLETVTGSLARLVGADCILQQKTTRNAQLRRLLQNHR